MWAWLASFFARDDRSDIPSVPNHAETIQNFEKQICLGDFKNVNWYLLPYELMIEILSFLDGIDLVVLSGTNRDFYNIFTEDSLLWKFDQTTRRGLFHEDDIQSCLKDVSQMFSSNRISWKRLYREIMCRIPLELKQVEQQTDLYEYYGQGYQRKCLVNLCGIEKSGKFCYGGITARGYLGHLKKSPIGLNVFFKIAECNGENIQVLLETSKGLFLVRSKRVIVCLDLSSNESFDQSVEYFTQVLKRNFSSITTAKKLQEKLESRICLLGTKSDRNVVSKHRLCKFLHSVSDFTTPFWKRKIIYIETSAKDRLNVDYPILYHIHLFSKEQIL